MSAYLRNGCPKSQEYAVESGMINLYAGELDGVLLLSEGAVLLQSGYTLLYTKLIQRGEGVFEIGGNITLGEEAYMSILGAVTIESTFKVLVDIKKDETIPAERLEFITGRVNLDGTGVFTINGADWFTTITQDDRGVLLSRQ